MKRVLHKANDVEYGLAASVWTSNDGRAQRCSIDLDFGTVWINDHIPLCAETPHGGFKKSGYGKDLSSYSLEEYTRVKHLMCESCLDREDFDENIKHSGAFIRDVLGL